MSLESPILRLYNGTKGLVIAILVPKILAYQVPSG